jgi:hypothetical protein
MDPNIQKALTDKLYDKRKSGALEYVTIHTATLDNTCYFALVWY